MAAEISPSFSQAPRRPDKPAAGPVHPAVSETLANGGIAPDALTLIRPTSNGELL